MEENRCRGSSGGLAKPGKTEVANECLIAKLYQEIGQLKVELDWLKKSAKFH